MKNTTCLRQNITCEILMLEPLDPDTTIAFRLLYSVRDFLAEPPVLSRASFRMRFTCEKIRLHRLQHIHHWT